MCSILKHIFDHNSNCAYTFWANYAIFCFHIFWRKEFCGHEWVFHNIQTIHRNADIKTRKKQRLCEWMWPINCETVTWFGNNWDGMLTFADHNLDFLSAMQPQRHVNICRLQFVYFVNNTTTAFIINFVTGRLRRRQNMYRDREGNLTIVLFLCFIMFHFLIHYKTARLRHRQDTNSK